MVVVVVVCVGWVGGVCVWLGGWCVCVGGWGGVGWGGVGWGGVGWGGVGWGGVGCGGVCVCGRGGGGGRRGVVVVVVCVVVCVVRMIQSTPCLSRVMPTMHRIRVAEHLGASSRRPRHPRALDDEELFIIEGSCTMNSQVLMTNVYPYDIAACT